MTPFSTGVMVFHWGHGFSNSATSPFRAQEFLNPIQRDDSYQMTVLNHRECLVASLEKVLNYGRGRNSYRILFTIVEGEDVSTVRILHIRHAAQQTLGENQESDET